MANIYKVSLNRIVTAIGVFANITVTDEAKLRLVITGVVGANTITVRARITGQTDFDLLATITNAGNSKQVINVSTYDQVRLTCTTFVAGSVIKVVAASFNGAASIEDPTGGIVASDAFKFTSSDSSVAITTDPLSHAINFRSISAGAVPKYIKTFNISEWIGPVAGQFSISIPYSIHLKTDPMLTCFELDGSQYDETYVPTIVEINNNIKIFTNTAFNGKIFIN